MEQSKTHVTNIRHTTPCCGSEASIIWDFLLYRFTVTIYYPSPFRLPDWHKSSSIPYTLFNFCAPEAHIISAEMAS